MENVTEQNNDDISLLLYELGYFFLGIQLQESSPTFNKVSELR